jgi:hypothetical protein
MTLSFAPNRLPVVGLYAWHQRPVNGYAVLFPSAARDGLPPRPGGTLATMLLLILLR